MKAERTKTKREKIEWLSQLVRGMYEWRAKIIFGISGVLLAVISTDFDLDGAWFTFFFKVQGWLWIIGIILFIWSLRLEVLDKIDAKEELVKQQLLEQKVLKLEEELQACRSELYKVNSDFHQIISDKLCEISVELGFSANERITVYRYSPDTESFHPIGRYCESHEYRQYGRITIPAKQGFIGQAWGDNGDGTCCIVDLPDPSRKRKEYFKKLNKVGFSDDEIKKLRMRSRSYYIYTIAESVIRDYGKNRLAVVVIESLSSNKFSQESARTVIENHEASLRSLIQRYGPVEPSLTYATELGL